MGEFLIMDVIRLSKSSLSEAEVVAVNNVLRRGYLGMGEEVATFERSLEEFFGRQTVCVNSGTASLQLALQACGIGVGDEVLVQSITYVASFQAIAATGALPVACEVNPDNVTLDIKDAERKINERTKAIMPMHYAGYAGDLCGIYQLAKKNNLRVIEDAAHAFGSLYKNKRIGSFGDVACFSFDGIKNITSGEGGCIVSSDAELLEKVRDIRLLGVEKDSANRYRGKRSWDFEVVDQGWRYHMSNIMAAIGSVQLGRFSELMAKRLIIMERYQKELESCSNFSLLDWSEQTVAPHIFPIICRNEKTRDLLKNALEDEGVETGVHYKPNHLLSFFSKQKSSNLPLSEKLYSRLLTLPLHPDLTTREVDLVVKILRRQEETTRG